MKEEFVYLIQKEEIEGKRVNVKASLNWTDKERILRSEGFTITIPKEIRSSKEIVLAVMSIKKTKEFEEYELQLHGHGDLPKEVYSSSEGDCYIDAGGDQEITLRISKELIKKWTALSENDLDDAFGSIKMGSTYNLMIALPRTLTITKDKIIIQKNKVNLINTINVCNLLLENIHPIDLD